MRVIKTKNKVNTAISKTMCSTAKGGYNTVDTKFCSELETVALFKQIIL